MERPLERVPSAGSPVPPERRLTEDDPNMDSMDRLRRDLEKLANKGRTSGTETRPLRKTGGGEDVEMEVKQEGTWYCKPPMSLCWRGECGDGGEAGGHLVLQATHVS